MADKTQARAELFDLMAATKKPSYSGDGFWIGEALDAVLANPDMLMCALGMERVGTLCDDGSVANFIGTINGKNVPVWGNREAAK